MASLDTNALLRWLLNDIPTQAKKVDTLINGHNELRASDVVIIELIYVLERVHKFPRELIAQNIIHLIEHPKIFIREKFFTTVLGTYMQFPKLSFVDCYAAYLAKEHGVHPLYTFDRKLASQLPQWVKQIP